MTDTATTSKDATDKDAARARRTHHRPQHRLIRDFMPPEGVPLHFEVAGLGMRLAAQLLDLVLTGLAMLSLALLLGLLDIMPAEASQTVVVLGFFLIRTPYYIVTEILWNGQTLGKRLTRLRVVGADGRSLRPFQITVRNLMKEAEVFYPGTMLLASPWLGPLEYLLLIVWIAVLLTVPLLNARRQRLGDMIAGTYVIHQPQAVLLPDVSARVEPEATARFSFLAHQLDHYGAFELQTLERVLHVDPGAQSAEGARRHAENLAAISDKIRYKIEYTEPVQPDETRDFLEAFYRAQRRYLENRKLFGDIRDDKFHDAGSAKGATGKTH